MKRKSIIFALAVMLFAFASCNKNSNETFSEDSAAYNEQRASELSEEIFRFIALIEGDKGEGKPYYCGARWMVWYGVTVKPDGSLIKKNDAPVSKVVGKEWCLYHIQNRLVPFFKYFDKHRLSDEQIIGCALFMYNVGGESVTGYNLKGEKVGEQSRFLQAVNAGEKDEYCVNCMTRYRKSGGKRANGLLKRHWVQGAAYLGILTPENILGLRPEQFYKTKNFGNYYWLDRKRNMIEKDGLYQLRYDSVTVNTFFNMNLADDGQKSVELII
uniref:Lysozyme n=1 Tax=uncultured Alphaproteobacteria bacterium TaxID=91750 RepID=A0A6G8F3A7_9PROT|nr:hypothetical protein PlAlph_6720 [uncultured Alphaproteobacteria bacterium]